jgi:hypothetical protein
MILCPFLFKVILTCKMSNGYIIHHVIAMNEAVSML